MSLWAHPGVTRTHGAYLEDEDEMPWQLGSASADQAALELTENEEQREKRLRREAQRRRRPVGFAPWPEEYT